MLSISLAFVVPDIGSFFLCFFCFSASVSLDSAQDRILPPNMDAVEQAVLWQEWVVILKQHQHWLREELNKWNNTLAKWDRWEEERARPQGRDLAVVIPTCPAEDIAPHPALLRTLLCPLAPLKTSLCCFCLQNYGPHFSTGTKHVYS